MALWTNKDLDVWREVVSLVEDIYRKSRLFLKEVFILG